MTIESKIEHIESRKGLGLGTFSLMLFLLGLLFSVSFNEFGAVGDHILRFFGLKSWSNGDTGINYTIIYALIFYIPALLIGHKFKNDWGAKVGRMLSTIFVVVTVCIMLPLLFDSIL